MWALSQITPPAKEPLDLDPDVYQHLRLEPDLARQETVLAGLIAAARQEGEAISRRQFITSTWELSMESWYEDGITAWDRLVIPLPPLQTVVSIKYWDSAGVEQTWDAANYTVQTFSGTFAQKGCVYPKAGVAYPGLGDFGLGGYRPDLVKIRYTAGYGADPAHVPALFRTAMLWLVAEGFERRELASAGVSKNIRQAKAIFFDHRAW